MEDLTGKQLGPYQIVAQLGIGGMATVFKAYQPKMDRYVALKVLPRYFSKNPEFISRFSQEARVIAHLEHPHILPVYDYGESDGYTYLVMRIVEGGSLADLLKKQGKLELRKTSQLISQVGGALDYAHQKGIIHRDFKPSNVLVDEFENCLLTDFGIAKLIEATSHLTHTGGILGTPTYVSPEQGSGKPIDRRSDIYSLGVVLYQMVTGDLPYKADTPMGLIYKHIHDPLPLPRQKVSELPESVERVILKALAKEPDDRYSTAAEMVHALQSIIDQPVTQIQQIQEPDPGLEPTKVEIETPAEPIEVPIEPPKEPVKEIIKPEEKVRTSRGLANSVLTILFLALLGGAGWYYYKNIFSAEPILKVESNPSGADVYVDDGRAGVSPVKVKELTPGTHKIRISKDRYQDYHENIFIQEGKPKAIMAGLAPKPFGDLQVNSNPSGAEVFIDDEQKGITPVALVDLPKGNRRVTLKKEGFDPWQGTVEIIPLKNVHISADLITIYGSLDISSDPSEALIFIDGKKVGKTPLLLEKIQKGKHKININKSGLGEWEQEILVETSKVAKVNAMFASKFGSLKVETIPGGAEWYLDGEYVGKTPGEQKNVVKGSHKVVIKKKGFKEWSRTIKVSAGQEKAIKASLVRAIRNSLGMEFVYITPGKFMMGSPPDEPGRHKDEKHHQVTLTKGFYMQTTEVTQGQWKAVMGSNPSYFKNCGDDCPVESVSWYEAREFIVRLNQREGGVIYRLPTEAEWEYAARAGSSTAFTNGGITEIKCGYDANLDVMGWYCGNSGVSYNGCVDLKQVGCAGTHPVAQKRPNAWGLYDIHGNVKEWCEDRYSNYPSGSVTDPEGGLSRGSSRVSRNGSWISSSEVSRSASRNYIKPNHKRYYLGFRLVRNLTKGTSKFIRDEAFKSKVIERDGQFIKYANGIVEDTKTGLEWYVGFESNWVEAERWTKTLYIAGGGWRMPRRDELKTLYKRGLGKRNMTPLLENDRFEVWSDEKESSSSAWYFHFYAGKEDSRILDENTRFGVIAVRSPKTGEKIHAKPIKTSTFIKQIVISGNTVIDTETLNKVLEPFKFKNRDLTLEEMTELTDLLTMTYQEEGYILARAYMPGQEIIDGVLNVALAEGLVDEIEVVGERTDKTVELKNCFEPQMKHGVIKESLLETGLTKALQIKGVDTELILTESKRPGYIKIKLDTTRKEKTTSETSPTIQRPLPIFIELQE